MLGDITVATGKDGEIKVLSWQASVRWDGAIPVGIEPDELAS